MDKNLRLHELELKLRTERKTSPFLSLLLGFLIFSAASLSALPFQKQISVQDGKLFVNGKATTTDVPPVKSGRDIFVPLRFVAEGLKSSVHYLAAKRAVEIVRGEHKLFFFVGKSYYYSNGTKKKLPVPLFLYRNRTMIPFTLTRREMLRDPLKGKKPLKAMLDPWPKKSFWSRVRYVLREEPFKKGNQMVARVVMFLWILGMGVFLFQAAQARFRGRLEEKEQGEYDEEED